MTYEIRLASKPEDWAAIALLIHEYVTWLRTRYQADQWFITEVLDKQSLANELDNLPAVYGAPNGKAYIALEGIEIRGCGTYRAFQDGSCEMKRVFVPSRFQGQGIGRALCKTLIAAARDDGFETMKLDTGKVMTETLSLYRALGFSTCEPYYEYPERLMPYFVFMELPLTADPSPSRSSRPTEVV